MKKQTIKKAHVRNMRSPITGRSIPNQFEIRTSEGVYFQSYQTVILFIDTTGQVYLDPKWKCSSTTSKYRNHVLGEKTKETQEKIDTGEYISGVVYLKVKTMYQTSEETVNYIEKSQRIWDIDAKRPTPWYDWENRKTTVKEQENYLSILEDVRAKQRRLETKNREYKNLLIWEE